MQPLQTSLFDDVREAPIEGLEVIPDYITAAEEAALIATIDQQVWQHDLKRLVQHYGWKYDYTARRVDASMRLGELPEWLTRYGAAMQREGVFPQAPDQVIINEYQPGQGIAAHVDCVPCFTDVIASISLGSFCMMEFTHGKTGEKVPILLEPRSLLVMRDAARYHWKHGIAPRKSDVYGGVRLPRARRLSLTFRKVVRGF